MELQRFTINIYSSYEDRLGLLYYCLLCMGTSAVTTVLDSLIVLIGDRTKGLDITSFILCRYWWRASPRVCSETWSLDHAWSVLGDQRFWQGNHHSTTKSRWVANLWGQAQWGPLSRVQNIRFMLIGPLRHGW